MLVIPPSLLSATTATQGRLSIEKRNRFRVLALAVLHNEFQLSIIRIHRQLSTLAILSGVAAQKVKCVLGLYDPQQRGGANRLTATDCFNCVLTQAGPAHRFAHTALDDFISDGRIGNNHVAALPVHAPAPAAREGRSWLDPPVTLLDYQLRVHLDTNPPRSSYASVHDNTCQFDSRLDYGRTTVDGLTKRVGVGVAAHSERTTNLYEA